MDWAAYAEIWPNAGGSRFVQARPHRWHVQILGPDGAPALLLLHGTGGATHSWRDLAPLLAARYRVIAPDLPGHGFTRLGGLQRSSLELMADDLGTLLDHLGEPPVAVIGHSAGGALALRLAQERPQVRAVIGLNAALESFEGAAGWLFPMMAKALALNPFVAPTVARMTSEASVRTLIEGTGSRLDALGLALYRACIADARHVDGALTMMAQWRLDRLEARLPETTMSALLLAAEGDRAVPPATSARAAERMPNGAAEGLGPLGHLAHEEAPDAVATRILDFLDATL